MSVETVARRYAPRWLMSLTKSSETRKSSKPSSNNWETMMNANADFANAFRNPAIRLRSARKKFWKV